MRDGIYADVLLVMLAMYLHSYHRLILHQYTFQESLDCEPNSICIQEKKNKMSSCIEIVLMCHMLNQCLNILNAKEKIKLLQSGTAALC